MDISDQLQQIRLLLAKNRFVSILEKVPVTVVTTVEKNGIAGQQPSHDRRERGGAGLQQEVEMVGNQRPGKAASGGVDQDGVEARDEFIPIRIVGKYLPTFDSAADDVVQGAGSVYAGLAGHGGD